MAGKYEIPIEATGWKRLLYRLAGVLVAFQLVGYALSPDTPSTALAAGVYYTIALYLFITINRLLSADVIFLTQETVVQSLIGFAVHAIVFAGALSANAFPLILRVLAVILTLLLILPLAVRPFGASGPPSEPDTFHDSQTTEEYGYNDEWEQENL